MHKIITLYKFYKIQEYMEKNKYELNRTILGEIDKRNFSQKNFEDLSFKNSIKIEKVQLGMRCQKLLLLRLK